MDIFKVRLRNDGHLTQKYYDHAGLQTAPATQRIATIQLQVLSAPIGILPNNQGDSVRKNPYEPSKTERFYRMGLPAS